SCPKTHCGNRPFPATTANPCPARRWRRCGSCWWRDCEFAERSPTFAAMPTRCRSGLSHEADERADANATRNFARGNGRRSRCKEGMSASRLKPPLQKACFRESPTAQTTKAPHCGALVVLDQRIATPTPSLVVAYAVAGVDLTRTADLHFRINLLFQPMRHPTCGAAQREHHGEHFRRNIQRLVNDAAVEIDVRVQLAGDEVIVLQCGLLQLDGDIEQRILHAQLA